MTVPTESYRFDLLEWARAKCRLFNMLGAEASVIEPSSSPVTLTFSVTFKLENLVGSNGSKLVAALAALGADRRVDLAQFYHTIPHTSVSIECRARLRTVLPPIRLAYHRANEFIEKGIKARSEEALSEPGTAYLHIMVTNSDETNTFELLNLLLALERMEDYDVEPCGYTFCDEGREYSLRISIKTGQ